ncbi:hypothetical protein RCL1_008269 [Eukaryota sp. TZLM3-RCL]
MELLTNSLQDLFDDKRYISYTEAVIISNQITCALTSSHSLTIVYCNVSAANVFVNADVDNRIIQAKLGLFDGTLDKINTLFRGNVAYSAPEVLFSSESYSAAVKVFSLAVLFYA